jgi:hypothetical protein
VSGPALATTFSKGRHYTHPITSEEARSVTTIISVYDKPALVGWAAREAAEYADKNWALLDGLTSQERVTLIKGAHNRRSNDASGLGTAVHEAVDAYCRGLKIEEVRRVEGLGDWPKDVKPFMTQFDNFLNRHKPEFQMTEVTVWNREFGYAGTFDWLAILDGRMTLGDTKTGKGVYPEVGLQLTALAHGEFILMPDGTELPMPDIEDLAVLHLRPRSWSLVPVAEDAEDRENTWEAFKAAATMKRWSEDTKPNVLGRKRR